MSLDSLDSWIGFVEYSIICLNFIVLGLSFLDHVLGLSRVSTPRFVEYSIICLNFIVLGLNEKHLLLYIYTHVTGSRYAIQID
jgi:hypothetical protein